MTAKDKDEILATIACLEAVAVCCIAAGQEGKSGLKTLKDEILPDILSYAKSLEASTRQ